MRDWPPVIETVPRWAHGRTLPFAAASSLVIAVVIIGVVGARTGGGDSQAGAPADPGAAVGSDAAVATTSTLATTTTAPRTTISEALHLGASGPEVTRLQERLAALGFQPGPVDGYFGELTQASIWAYQKLVRGVDYRVPDGIVTPEMWLELQEPLPIEARRPEAGKHTEIYLPEQALIVFDGERPLFISHISSGELEEPGDDFNRGQEWCEEVTIDPGEAGNENGTEPLKKGVCGNAWTPGGVYEFYRKVEGVRESRLGGMLNPVYFNYGIAVHGAYNVPRHPDSHGCIRIPNLISATFQNLVQTGEQVFVFDGVEEPETYGAQSGLWDWADPNYTTTTTATTAPPTTAAATTQAPTTAAPTTAPPTTRPPAPTQPATTRPPVTQPPTTRPATTQPATTAAPTTTAAAPTSTLAELTPDALLPAD